ncbi:tRNA adenosine(34) deaminase TadA [Gammaproteobacteria bacterium]|nr:tRNA adenosine(34) deaminase TadA [Gammaproteobacteria bacterium]
MAKNNINYFMAEAMILAKLAFKNNEIPVGALVVNNGKIIGTGFNQVIAKHSISSHAEINAINEASKYIKNYRLNGCDIYVTLEPCHMCAKAIVDARIKSLYFGAYEPKTGAIESIDQFLDKDHLNHKVLYSGGYLQEQSSNLLKKFFESRRKKKIS